MYYKPGQGCSHSDSMNHQSKSGHTNENKNGFRRSQDILGYDVKHNLITLNRGQQCLEA